MPGSRPTSYAAKVSPDGATIEPDALGQEVLHTDYEDAKLWPKKTAANTREDLYESYPAGSDKNESDDKSERHVSFSDVAKTVGERSRTGRLNFWIKYISSIASMIWNIASPIKSYVLSFYGLPGDDLVFSQNLNWTMEVDYQYARALYDKSGIDYTAPEGKPIRFINMYNDFVVFNRATNWARYLDDFQQDPYVGQFCRASLVPGNPMIRAEMDYYCLTNGYFAGNNLLEQLNCRVNEVSEAVMCLKGIDALTLLNYEWTSSFDPTNPDVQAAMQAYQHAIFPNLTACLERRELLVRKMGRDDALVQLSKELATNFSLEQAGFGGKKGLYEEFRFYEGFTDLSGKPSGVRYSKMSGSLPERTQPTESDTNALVAGRERLWWDEGLTPAKFRAGILGFAYYGPYLFIGLQINNKADTGRFIERYALETAGNVGICQNWNLAGRAKKTFPTPSYLDGKPQTSVLTGFGSFFAARAMKDQNVTDPAQQLLVLSRMTTQCITRDGCVDACSTPHAASWLATFNRSGACHERVISQSTLHRQGFVDWRCMGEGTGKNTFIVSFSEQITRADGSKTWSSSVKNIADPAAIISCVLGGRVPQDGDEPFPNVFFDLIKNGPNTIITTTFSRGTEKVLVNVYALVSLVGCLVFSVWVVQNLKRLTQMLLRVKAKGWCDRKALTQLLDSFFTVNLSTVSHGRNIQLSKVILWLNLVTWYIGAADSNCTWFVDEVDIWTEGFALQTSDSPYYKCKPGYFVDFLDSFIGVVRILSISYNFYSLTCQHLILRGATRYVLPFLSPIIFFGVLPTFIASTVITGINHLRLQLGILSNLHNQLFLVMLWVFYLFGYHWMLQNATIGHFLVGLLCKLKLCGKQRVKPGSAAEALIGKYYLTLPSLVRDEATEWIPLSVALEALEFDIERLNFALRKYSFKNRVRNNPMKAPVKIPQWVLDDEEFFFC